MVSTPPPAFNVWVADCLRDHKADFSQSLLFSQAMTEGVWINQQYFMITGIVPGTHPEFVFPLWESLGLARERHVDPLDLERVGPMSAAVDSGDFVWQLNGQALFIQDRPIEYHAEPKVIRQFLVLPERCAAAPVPIACVFKAPTWKPFAEDYIIRMGIPKDTQGLRAVCVFMSATDAQLEELFKTLGVPPEAQNAPEK